MAIKLSKKDDSKSGDEATIIALPTSAFIEKCEKLGLKEYIKKIDWKLVLGFLQWYGMNAAYVICNKRFLNAVMLPWSLSSYQLLIGWLFMGVYWGFNLRPTPYFETKRKFLVTFLPLGFLHLFVHLGAVISMGLGAVSFTHVIKAGEPVITALLSMLFLREFLNVYAYLALIPVMGGVALTSAAEAKFCVKAFVFAMVSNVCGAARSVLTKVTMKNKEDIGENLTASNIYLILTLISSVMSLPFVLFIEAPVWFSEWRTGTMRMATSDKAYVIINGLLSGFFYFLANDGAFYCLSQINQVSYSVANTAKRVILISSSIIVFRNTVAPLGYVGMAIAILGTFLYSLVK
ncbi:solute carrier family 35 like protein [Babesia gibsoni]|uniref:Solute carrier family 35 like protein n=1 Tax=Babesia gibsoni TaxID=33632 RepID=A0AAD8P8B8_BABGI|nr:solute carrier family 35 like protein [Babesia gibsoni]